MIANSEPALPSVELSSDSIMINLRKPLSTDIRQVRVRAVIDQDSDGELQGIEIINLMDQIGDGAFDAWKGAKRPFTYDKAVDAFYLRLRTGHSPRQRAVDASVHIDTAGLFRITVPKE